MAREVKDGDEDDRVDDVMRHRVDELVAGMDAYRQRLDARYRMVTWALIVVTIVSMLTAGFAWHNASDTNESLCTLRADFERRAAQGKQFLKENPEGVAGIPAETLAQSIRNQERTVESLADLNCPPPPQS